MSAGFPTQRTVCADAALVLNQKPTSDAEGLAVAQIIGRGWALWCGALGFALGGFFDGILLHQILQWHHLLSLVPAIADLRTQVLWDGYFHALMYVIASVALYRLWKLNRSGNGRNILSPLLIGFGAWHVADAVLSHWLLGIHRIRPESSQPLFWDLLWLVVFGLLPMVAGGLFRPPGPPKHRTVLVSVLSVIALISGVWALQPPAGQPGFTTAVFYGDAPAEKALGAIAATDAQLIWAAPDLSVVVLNLEGRKSDLYRHGAVFVSGSLLPAGCFGWARA